MNLDFEAYWQRLVASNDALDDVNTKMTISVHSFKRQLEKAFEAAEKSKRVRFFDKLFGGKP